MEWARKRKAELEKALKSAYSTLIRNRRLQTLIKEMLDYTPSRPYVAGDSRSINSFLKWFSQVRELGIAEIKKKAEEGRWVKRFTQANSIEMGNLKLQDPDIIMRYVKKELQEYRETLSPKIKDLQNRITDLRHQIHLFEVEEENRILGRASVRLTKINILMSILIPIATFLIGLILSLLMEATKPEITHWIRGLLRLTIP